MSHLVTVFLLNPTLRVRFASPGLAADGGDATEEAEEALVEADATAPAEVMGDIGEMRLGWESTNYWLVVFLEHDWMIFPEMGIVIPIDELTFFRWC